MRLKPFALIIEMMLAYATPAYLWFWGLITLPVWVLGAGTGNWMSILYVAAILSGLLGAAGTILMLVDIAVDEPPDEIRVYAAIGLGLCGLFGVWTPSLPTTSRDSNLVRRHCLQRSSPRSAQHTFPPCMRTDSEPRALIDSAAGRF